MRVLRIFCLFTVVFAAVVAGDGIIIPFPYPRPYPIPQPYPPYPPIPEKKAYNLDIKYHRVDVTVVDGVATTSVDEEFENPYDFELEGTYIFPLPKGAAFNRFSLKVDGEAVEGKILNADEAAKEYRKLVNENRDPAILEYVGRGAIQARIYPIPARGKKRVQIEYAEVLNGDGGTFKYVYPLDTERFSRVPIDDVEVNVSVTTTTPLESLFSPSHDIAVTRENANAAAARYVAAKTKPSQDFVLYAATGRAEVGSRLITYERDGEDGYFLLVITPPEAAEADPFPKDVVFVVDISGSMAGDKLEQVREALAYCLRQLRPEDRFNVVTFNETAKPFRENITPANEAEVDAALRFVKAFAADGGTNIDGALTTALASFKEDTDNVPLVVFLTDGKPTVGERDVAEILSHCGQANAVGARVFPFGVGYNVKTELLDNLARKNGGTSQYILPAEDAGAAVTAFYRKVANPVLSDVTLTWTAMDVSGIYPPTTPDIFAGTQLTLIGRYKTGTAAGGTLTVAGKRSGREEVYGYDLASIIKRDNDARVLEQLWAVRKIGYMLEQIKLEGEDEDLIAEVVSLSKRYGIPTPYTSYLVSDAAPANAGERRTLWYGSNGAAEKSGFDPATAGRWMAGEAGLADGTASAPSSMDELRVKESVALGAYKGARMAAPVNRETGSAHVGGKTFIRRDGVWRDIALNADAERSSRTMVFGSDEYFGFLEKHAAVAPFLALGDAVIFESSSGASHWFFGPFDMSRFALAATSSGLVTLGENYLDVMMTVSCSSLCNSTGAALTAGFGDIQIHAFKLPEATFST